MAKLQNYWLLKSEPEVYAIGDLERDGSTHWEGVRNYQARNYLRDQIHKGDGVLFYHSGTDKAIMGRARVSRAGYVDPAQFDPASKYYDKSATPEQPRWYMVDIAFELRFARPLTLAALRTEPGLKDMGLLKRGQRLSVQPVTEAEWAIIGKLAAR